MAYIACDPAQTPAAVPPYETAFAPPINAS